MAVPTFLAMRTTARDRMLDTDAANYAIDDTTLKRIVNACYVVVKGLQGDHRTQFIAAVTSGASVSVANTGIVLLSSVNIREIVNVFPAPGAASTTPSGAQLERWPEWQSWAMRVESATAGTPTAFSAVRQSTTVAASVGKWLLTFWRIPDASIDYVIEAVVEPPDLVADADIPDVKDTAAYAIAYMAAAVCARLLGRSDEQIADIKALIPPAMQGVMAQVEAGA